MDAYVEEWARLEKSVSMPKCIPQILKNIEFLEKTHITIFRRLIGQNKFFISKMDDFLREIKDVPTQGIDVFLFNSDKSVHLPQEWCTMFLNTSYSEKERLYPGRIIPRADVRLVKSQTGCDFEKALDTLRKCNGDIVNSIMEIG